MSVQMDTSTRVRTAAGRNRFVTGLSWSFILVGSFVAVTLLAMLTMPQYSLMFADLAAALEPGRGTGGLTAGAHWLVEQRTWLLPGLLLAALATVAVAVALLQRRYWARRAFVGLMVCGFFGAFTVVALSPLVFTLLPDGRMPTADGDNPLGGLVGIMATGIVGATMLAGLFGWAGWKLTSRPVRDDFGD